MKKKIIYIILIVLIISLSSSSYASELETKVELNGEKLVFTESTGSPFISEGRTLVPLRITTESIKANVVWDGDNNQAIVEKGNIKLRIPINEDFIYRNNEKVKNDSKAVVKNGRTFLPIRVVMESLDYNVSWDGERNTVILNEKKTIKSKNDLIKLDYKYNNKNYVKGFVLKPNSDLDVEIALANDEIGTTASLSKIAKDNGALLAINGSYFSAYNGEKVKDPYGIIVIDGKVVHNANDRAVIGFSDGKIDIDRVDTNISGDNGDPDWKYSWNGYWINHSIIGEGFSTTVYTTERGLTTKEDQGTNYIVSNGKIVEIQKNKSVDIPEDGFVVNINGIFSTESPNTVYDRFKKGYPCDYKVGFIPENSNSKEFWNDIDYAVGAGPALILDGKININFVKEHFTETKITNMSHSRSAIGYKSDGSLVLITTTATIEELTKIMKELGCYEAMNLDGGASSGLFYNGEYLRKPGRDLSNIILIK